MPFGSAIFPAPPLGTPDPAILNWAAASDRVLVTADKRTMPFFVRSHLAAGLHTAGVIVLLPRCTLPDLIQFVALASHATEAGEWVDRLEYVG